MHSPLTEAELRAAWQRLRMSGDFDKAMSRTPVRCAVEAAARAFNARIRTRETRSLDAKERAAGERES
ncbi:hypothetical protein [Paraburkholderia bonniea]|uniref:hypothetical protein n=1 Tax=Paraburkholderia bonniea TaxID=2152891 RepID=UPI0012916FE7|nr:hypothetical protein [Paraburkholderia bonniea]